MNYTMFNFEEELNNYISRTDIYPTDCVINTTLYESIERDFNFFTLIENDKKYTQKLCGITLHRGDGEQLIYFYKNNHES